VPTIADSSVADHQVSRPATASAVMASFTATAHARPSTTSVPMV